MDKRVEQSERVLDLAGYVPEFLRDVTEFRQLYGAQEYELKRLYGKMDELWKDSLIPSATIQGIKRFERMIGLKPYPGDTLEERRSAVSLKWNQQLPYTIPRLRERLEHAVGEVGYELWVRENAYELELWILDQPYRVLQDLRDMTRQMIPANLVLGFVGKYPGKIVAEVTAGCRMELMADFFARYNREFLYLDGNWWLDGTYLLNGYKEIDGLDLYPARMAIQSEWRSPVTSSWLWGYGAGVGGTPETGTDLRITGAAVGQPAGEGRIGLAWMQPAAPEMDCQLRVEHNLWYLDGTAFLDGSSFLDAEIFEYDL